ncbi:hypothetical protein MLD38_038523 [Melastoma candidum]|uniref:Uncharacterized protein n=1 Tax=Melastoma candidum TaxID=119954 RepID=A0ACB9KZH8_9MYRT|nr:hypothetical protein MLD38_038523 [Melastoma candidum]
MPNAAAFHSACNGGDRFQHVIVMRHGDRLDNVDPMWTANAERPWDPPLAEEGRVRAFSVGRKLREDCTGFPIHRVFVSPFLRCIQTAREAVMALSSVDSGDDVSRARSDGLRFEWSKLKVAIEYGLSEMLNQEAIWTPPKDGVWGFNIPELESMLPAGTVDHSVECLYKEIPQWEETVSGARSRYEQVIRGLADKYPSENLLLVTHGEGVGVSVSAFMDNATVQDVEYCAYSHLRRSMSLKDGRIISGELECFTNPAQTGITLLPNSSL